MENFHPYCAMVFFIDFLGKNILIRLISVCIKIFENGFYKDFLHISIYRFISLHKAGFIKFGTILSITSKQYSAV